MSEAIAALPAPTQDVVVLARNPQEMVAAQTGLINWAKQKLASVQAELQEKETNLAHATKMKIRTQGWMTEVKRAVKSVVYYQKMLSALEAGYCIVPAFPIQVIAVRTKRKKPNGKVQSRLGWSPLRPSDVKADILSEGEGRYVDPTPQMDVWQEPAKKGDGSDTTRYNIQAVGLDEAIDLPFKVVRPQILTDLSRAMTLKIFDEIGVLPAARTNADPMVVGVIHMRQGSRLTSLNFLITWWIDTRDL